MTLVDVSERTVTVPALLGGPNALEIRFPKDAGGLQQDQEWFEVLLDGEWQRHRFHDYDELYRVPGLYEALFYRVLRCNSPLRVVSLLNEVLKEEGEDAEDLCVLDVGAGNGMVGYELQGIGVQNVLGIDIIEDAKLATQRERPWCYTDYVVDDLTALSAESEERILRQQPNAMTCVAALGFGDIPTTAFLKSVDLLDTPAWMAFNVKEDFVHEREHSGFAEMLRDLARSDIMQIRAYRRYRHRLSSAGEPLHYIAMVAQKRREIPRELYSLYR